MDYLQRTRKLEADMREAIGQWDRRGGFTTLGDAAFTVKGWLTAVDNIENYPEAQSGELQDARKALEDAWDKRDNRKGALSAVKSGYKAIKSLNSILNGGDPISPRTSDRMSRGALFGDNVAGVPTADANTPLRRVVMALKGIMNAPRFDYRHYNQIDPLCQTIAEVGGQYADYPQISSLAEVAINSIQYGKSSIKSSTSMTNAKLEHAIKTIQKMMGEITAHHTPEGYKPQADFYQVESARRQLDAVKSLFNGKSFEQPSQVAIKAVKHLKEIKKELASTSNYRAVRLTDDAIEALRKVHDVSNSTRVKSRGGGWEIPGVQDSVELFLHRLTVLEQGVTE